MVKKRCQDWDCDLTIDDSIVEERKEWEKRFSFPKYWVSVLAKDIEEANEKIKAIVNEDYETKSI